MPQLVGVDTLYSNNTIAIMTFWWLMQGNDIYRLARSHCKIEITIIKRHNSDLCGYFMILCTSLCFLRLWIFFCPPVKLWFRFQMFQVVSVLIHSYINLILILVLHANKEIQRPGLSCMSCNAQHPLKSLLFLHGWLMLAGFKYKTVCRLCVRPILGWEPFSKRDEVGLQQLWSF